MDAGRQSMTQKKKRRYDQALAPPFDRVAPAATFTERLQRLVNIFFGKSDAYVPSRQEIVDYHFTAREREIAYLAALGFSDKEIADALAMNFQTVRVHLRNALNKLGLESPSELREYFIHGEEE